MMTSKERGRKRKLWFVVYFPMVTIFLSCGAFLYFLYKEGKLDGVLGIRTSSGSGEKLLRPAISQQVLRSNVLGVPPEEKPKVALPVIEHRKPEENSRPSTHKGIVWPRLLTKTPSYDGPSDMLSQSPDSYPKYASLLSIIEAWNPDHPDPPPVFVETLQHFNYSDPVEREIAARYRDAEVPFKLYDVPEVDAITTKWTDEYLTSVFSRESHRVEVAEYNHFMFWTHSSMRSIDPNWKPPTENIQMSFPEWRAIAADADKNKLRNDTKHYYFHANAPAGDRRGTFVARDLTFFATNEENFFITNVPANKGIQCRFGMRGIIAETHYDGGKNMVAMLKGQKRYILSPPFACKYLGIISNRKHTSYRHSVIDWSNVAEAKANRFDEAASIDTIVKEGEVLYIPSYWFHYPVSLEYSVQCNSRSGAPPMGQGQADIEECTGVRMGGAGDRNFMQKAKGKGPPGMMEMPRGMPKQLGMKLGLGVSP